MTNQVIGVLGFTISLVMILLGAPVAVSLGVVGVIGFGLVNGWASAGFVLATAPFEGMSSYSLSVIPLFLMMGTLAARSGLAGDLYGAANALIGRFRGGLAIATIGACAGFGAICGSSLATVATIGRVALPEMRAAGYDDRLSSASVAAAGTLGVMIPPSVLLIIYGLLTETSIGKLFSAAIIPGLLATMLYALAVVVQVWLNPALATVSAPMKLRPRLRAIGAAWPAVTIFVVVIGGIQLGMFSPTEAAAIGAASTIAMVFVRSTLSSSLLTTVLQEVVEMTGTIFLIIVGAAIFTYFIETTGLAEFLVRIIGESGLSPMGVLLLVMVFYILLGCVMDSMSMIFLTIPIVFPMIQSLGFDPVWFGILVVTVAEIGLITPPVGMNLFVIQGIAPGLTSGIVIRGILPFLLADIVRLTLLIAVPAITLWLPLTMK